MARTDIEQFEYLIRATEADEHAGRDRKVFVPIDLARRIVELAKKAPPRVVSLAEHRSAREKKPND